MDKTAVPSNPHFVIVINHVCVDHMSIFRPLNKTFAIIATDVTHWSKDDKLIHDPPLKKAY